MMGMQHETRAGSRRSNSSSDVQYVVARRHIGAIADAEDMGVHSHRVLAKRHVEHNIGGLAPRAPATPRFRCGCAARAPPIRAISFADSAITFFALVR